MPRIVNDYTQSVKGSKVQSLVSGFVFIKIDTKCLDNIKEACDVNNANTVGIIKLRNTMTTSKQFYVI